MGSFSKKRTGRRERARVRSRPQRIAPLLKRRFEVVKLLQYSKLTGEIARGLVCDERVVRGGLGKLELPAAAGALVQNDGERSELRQLRSECALLRAECESLKRAVADFFEEAHGLLAQSVRHPRALPSVEEPLSDDIAVWLSGLT